MTTSKESLFHLIKALSPSEKRYFRLHADLYTGKKERAYLELFDLLDKMKTYDKAKVEHHFKGRKLLNNLSAAKSYLMESIMDALIVYKKPTTTDERIQKLFSRGNLLIRKGLHPKAMQLFKRGNELAAKTHNYSRYYEGLKNIRNLVMRGRRGDYTDAFVDQLHIDMLETGKREQELTMLKRLHYRCLNLTTKGLGAGDKAKSLQPLKQEMGQDYFKVAANSLNPIAQVFHQQVWNQYHILEGNYAASYESLKKVHQLYLGIPFWIDDNPSSYLAILSNLLARSTLNYDWENFEALLLEMESMPMRDEISSRMRYESLSMHRLIYASATGNSLTGEELKVIVDDFLKMAKEIKPVFKAAIELHLAIYYFTIGEWDLALKGLNHFLNEASYAKMVQHRMFARLCFICLQYDLGNYGLVASELERVKRKAAESGGYTLESEKLLIDCLSNCIRKPVNEHKEIFSAILPKVDYERMIERFQVFFDLQSWIQSKVEGVDLQEAIRTQFQRDLLVTKLPV